MISIRTDLVYETMEAAAEQGVIDGIISEDVKSGDIEVNRIKKLSRLRSGSAANRAGTARFSVPVSSKRTAIRFCR